MTDEPHGATLSPNERAARSRSFGSVATQYERYRPGPPPEAVAWLLPRRVDTVVDMGAGTGALSRLLIDRADRVVAVEPDARMRDVLTAQVAGVTTMEGRAESIPLDDATVDAVVASSSWHWVDPAEALPEVARVLKPGGVLGAMWSGPDGESPFMLQARDLLAGATGGAGAETLRVLEEQQRPVDHALRIPAVSRFGQPDVEVVRWDMALAADDLVGLLGTMSWVILMPPDERDALLALTRRLLADGLGVEGDVTVDVPFRCNVYRSRLLD